MLFIAVKNSQVTHSSNISSRLLREDQFGVKNGPGYGALVPDVWASAAGRRQLIVNSRIAQMTN
jgi:hypothetical protein